jgi:hypothetical protein
VTRRHGKQVRIHAANGAELTCELLPDDFQILHVIATGNAEIKTIEKAYRRLRNLGLVRHQFSDGDWPKALARLTQAGEQALSQRDA